MTRILLLLPLVACSHGSSAPEEKYQVQVVTKYVGRGDGTEGGLMPGTAAPDGCEAHISMKGAPPITFDLGDFGDCDKVTVFQGPTGSTITFTSATGDTQVWRNTAP